MLVRTFVVCIFHTFSLQLGFLLIGDSCSDTSATMISHRCPCDGDDPCRFPRLLCSVLRSCVRAFTHQAFHHTCRKWCLLCFGAPIEVNVDIAVCVSYFKTSQQCFRFLPAVSFAMVLDLLTRTRRRITIASAFLRW